MLGRALAKNENVLKFKTHRMKRDERAGIIGVASNHRYIDRNTGRKVVLEKRKESGVSTAEKLEVAWALTGLGIGLEIKALRAAIWLTDVQYHRRILF